MIFRFAGLGLGELQSWDEGLYALRARIALDAGLWWDQASRMPSGAYYASHPPLYVWLGAISMKILGQTPLAIRVPSAVAGALLVALIFAFARLRFEKKLAVVTALIVGFSALMVINSRQGQLDSLLALLMLASMYALLRSGDRYRSRWIVMGGIALGMALMTKLLFALSVPSALLLASLTRRTPESPALRMATILACLVSLVFWLPWVLDFSLRHGAGNPFYLLSGAAPFGQTLAGMEGTTKDTGILYYANQLVVHLSLFAPLAAMGWVGAWQEDRAVSHVSAVFSVLYLAAIWIMGSSFEAYLVPVFPVLVVLAMVGYERATLLPDRSQFRIALMMLLCGAWSSSLSLRELVKTTFSQLLRFSAPDAEVLAVAMGWLVMIVVAMLALFLLYKRGLMHRLFSPHLLMLWMVILTITTGIRIWVKDSDANTSGAVVTAKDIRSSNSRTVLLIGTGWNPQLSWYLDGEDLGWTPSPRRYIRLEPAMLGWNGVVQRIRWYQQSTVLVIVEKDEVLDRQRTGLLQAMRTEWSLVRDTRVYTLFALKIPEQGGKTAKTPTFRR